MKQIILFTVLCTFATCILDVVQANQYRNYPDMEVSTERSTLTNSMMCMNIRPQHSVDIEEIMGLWHASEIIMHTADVPGISNYKVCITIQLTDITAQMQSYYNNNNNNHNNNNRQYGINQQRHNQPATTHSSEEYTQTKYLRLLWNENDVNFIEYTFNFTDLSPGLWMNVGEQRGSMVIHNKYTQFTGTVQIVKAVNDHLLLTFCGDGPQSAVYTVVLSRTVDGLSEEEIRSIRGLLSRRGLHPESIRRLCSSAAGTVKISISVMLFTILLGLVGVFSKNN